MNGRVYDYNLGRFLSVDPFIQAPGNSQSMNPYSYVMNNPLSGTDPTGYICQATRAFGTDGAGECQSLGVWENDGTPKVKPKNEINNGTTPTQGLANTLFKGVDFEVKTLEEIEAGENGGTSVSGSGVAIGFRNGESRLSSKR